MEEDIKNRIQELSTYKEKDKETVRKICINKSKTIVDYDELYAIENILNELERLQKDNYKLDRENQILFEANQQLQYKNEFVKRTIKN